MRDIKDQVCDRADDLVAFLYGELGEKDAREFERHLHECARCETEFAAFGQIRKSIVSWRDESLGAAWLTGAVTDRSLAPATIPVSVQTRPSALAAIRAFFNLSPMWMKGAAAFASLLFCVSAVLAIAYLKGRQPSIVEVPNNKIYSQQELDAQVAQRVQMEIDEMRNQQPKQSDNEVVVNVLPSKKPANRAAVIPRTDYATTARSLRKPLTQKERQELAADLGLLASRDEDNLDLVTDKINQAP